MKQSNMYINCKDFRHHGITSISLIDHSLSNKRWYPIKDLAY